MYGIAERKQEWIRIESLETDPCIYGHYDKDGTARES